MSTKRYIITICVLIAVILTGFIMLAKTPLLIRSVGFAGRALYGYDVSADSFSISKAGQIRSTGFTVKDARNGNFIFTAADLNIEKDRERVFRTDVEKIVMKDPKIRIRVGGNKKETETDLSFIKKIPAVHLLTMVNGEFTVLFKGSNSRIIIRNINLRVENFSPDTGGLLDFTGILEIDEPGRPGFFLTGKCKGRIDLKGIFPDLKGRGNLEITVARSTIGGIIFEGAKIIMPLNFEHDRIEASRVTMSVDHVSLPKNGGRTQLENGRLSLGIRYQLTQNTLDSGPIDITVPGIGNIKGLARMTLKGPMPIVASVETNTINFSRCFEIAKSFMAEDESRKWAVQGAGSLKASMRGTLAGKSPQLSGSAVMDIKKGGFTSPDGSKAAQGMDGSVTLYFSLPAGEKDSSVKISSRWSSGEYLWGKYYKDLRNEKSQFSSNTDMVLNPRTGSRFKGTINIFNTGRYAYDGFFSPDGWRLHVNAQDMPINRIIAVFGREYLGQVSASMKDMEADGKINADISLISADKKLSARGKIDVSAQSIALPAISLAIKGIDANLPFDLVQGEEGKPSPADKQAPLGMIRVSGFKKGDYNLSETRIPFVASGSDIIATGIISLPFYGGSFRIRDLAARDVLGKSPRVSFAASVAGIDFPTLLNDLTGLDFPGNVKARFPMITYQDGELKTEGSLAIDIFNGRIEIFDIYARDIFAASRKIGGDVTFNDIDLGTITDIVKVGKITGIVKGSVKDLVIEYGQPSRFIFDLDTVIKSGVSRKVSVDAIENISILGTGSSGIGAILKSGLNKFFKEYPYSRIGIRCTLENDNFNIRGKIIEGGKEYLIRRAFLRGIDVVNRDPQNMVSFKDMQERVSRVFNKEKEGPTIKVN